MSFRYREGRAFDDRADNGFSDYLLVVLDALPPRLREQVRVGASSTVAQLGDQSPARIEAMAKLALYEAFHATSLEDEELAIALAAELRRLAHNRWQ